MMIQNIPAHWHWHSEAASATGSPGGGEMRKISDPGSYFFGDPRPAIRDPRLADGDS